MKKSKREFMDKVRLKEKIGYGLGDAASSMFWKLFHPGTP